MKRLSTLLTMLLFSVLIMNGGKAWSASPPSPAQEKKFAQALIEADLAFNRSDYVLAKEILRQSLPTAPSYSELWNRYNRAVLAESGNDYLLTLPTDRYRIDSRCLADDLQKRRHDYFLLDIRQPEEFAAGHLAGAVNIPLRQVLGHLDQLPKPGTGKILLIICRSQHRANHVLVILRELGYTNSFTLLRGYEAYLSLHKISRNDKTANGSCPKGPDNQRDKNKNEIAVVPPKEIAGLMSDADTFFAENRFGQARGILEQALIKTPGYEEIWQKYNRAVLAVTGNRYLRDMPEAGYRVKVEKFGTDYQKGPGLGKYFLLDVRDADEFAMGHIAGSINIPFRTVLQHIHLLPKPDSGKILLLICRSGHRAIHDLVLLRELGYSNAFTLQGGYHAFRTWLKNLAPTQKGTENGNGIEPPSPQPGTKQVEDFGC